MANTLANPDQLIEQAARDLLGLVREIGKELHLSSATIDALDLDSAFQEDLRLDSLAQVEFFCRIEKHFGIALPEAAFTQISTPRKLLEFILAAEHLDHALIASSISHLLPAPARKIPRHPGTLVDVLNWHAENNPDRPHIKFYADGASGETLTFGELKQHAERLACGLQRRGLRPKETVAIMLPSSKAYVVAFFAVVLAGGIPVPLPPPSRQQHWQSHLAQYRRVISSCNAKLLITDAQSKNWLVKHAAALAFIHTPLTQEDLEDPAGRLITPQLSGQDIAYIQYTPGVTGEPKGVMLSHANLLANIQATGEWIGLSSDDVWLNWLPLHHNMGLVGAWLTSLFYAALLANMPPLYFLVSPQRWLWAIHHFRATFTAAPNFAYELCLQQLDDDAVLGLDLSSLRIALNGGEPVQADTVEQFCQRFAPYGFRASTMMPMFGLAESAFALTLPPIGRGMRVDRIRRDELTGSGRAIPADKRDPGLRSVSLGQALIGHEIRVVDSLGDELPERCVGKLEFRGPSSTPGYYDNPQETRRLQYGQWLASGDLAYIANGELYVTGRATELIHRHGRTVHPLELTQAIGRLPGIINGLVAVFTRHPEPAGQPELIVLAGTREQEAAELDTMRSGVQDASLRLIGFVPDDIAFASPEAIPKTSAGQIKYGASRDFYEQWLRKTAQSPLAQYPFSSQAPGWTARLGRRIDVVTARLYGAYFWTALSLMTAVTYCLLMLLPLASWRWRLAHAAAKLFFAATGIAITVTGREHMPSPRQHCIFVCNHTSYLDGFILIQVLPQPFSYVAKAALGRNFFARTFLSRIGTIFVNRFDKEKGIQDAARIVRQAQAGKSFLFFPEGTFTRKSGLLPFHLGAFVTACDTGLPIVPITLRGARALLRDENWLPRHVDVTVAIHPSVDPASFIHSTHPPDRLAAILALRDAVRDLMLKHVGEPDRCREEPPV